MRQVFGIVALLLLVGTLHAEEEPVATSIHDFTMKSIEGEDVSLGTYTGKVLLVVNVASKCGFTGQYKELQELHDKYREQGFAVLGFPANNFLGQEPGTNGEIQQFCRMTYGVTFPMFAKISVKGKDQHPLYAWLTGKDTNPQFAGKISWNFNKFLVNGDGHVIARFGSRDEPMGKDIVAAVEKALGDVSAAE